MDQHLDLVLQWFKRLGIDASINLDKLKRQLSIIDNWFKSQCRGVMECVTGFGKSMVAIIAIHRLNQKYPDANIIIVVPDTNLFNDWTNHIYNFDLRNTKVFVVNSYVNQFIEEKTKHKCTLLVLDEVHNYLSEEAKIFNQTIGCTNYEMLLGMTATLDDKERETLEVSKIPIFDKVTMSEALRFNYISNYVIYNIGITLDANERDYYNKVNDIHNSNFAKFRWFPESELNYELARACTAANARSCKVGQEWNTGRGWREWYSEQQGFDGTEDHPWHPNAIARYAHQWNWAMAQRKDYVYKHPKKIALAKDIIQKLNLQTITFGQTTDTADSLTEQLGDIAKSYHSNLPTITAQEEHVEERKNYKSAKLFRQRNQGELSVDNSSGKPVYVIKYKKDIKISQKKQLLQIKSDFESKKIKVLNTAKALDEGFNVEGIECAIIYAILSTKRNFLQRIGRSLRYIEGKKATIIVIYIAETQDETWVKKAQKGEGNIRWITNLNEIE